MTIKTGIKKSMLRNRLIARVYEASQTVRSIPPADFLHLGKLKLMLAVKPYTMLTYARLSKIHDLASELEARGIEGAFVECGVWNGGSAGIMAAIARDNTERHLWLFDSWEGMPEPGPWDVSAQGQSPEKGMARGSEETVADLVLRKVGLERGRMHPMKGWFEETIPAAADGIGRVALLHLDCDWYQSVKIALNQLYDRVVAGGYIVIDDYGWWHGCARAVDEFSRDRKLKFDLRRVDDSAVFFRK
jgi:hypothetical protein